jgi:hypothetical protein
MKSKFRINTIPVLLLAIVMMSVPSRSETEDVIVNAMQVKLDSLKRLTSLMMPILEQVEWVAQNAADVSAASYR